MYTSNVQEGVLHAGQRIGVGCCVYFLIGKLLVSCTHKWQSIGWKGFLVWQDGQKQIVIELLYIVRYGVCDGWRWVRVSCMAGMFMVRDSRQNVVIVGCDNYV